MIEKLKDFANFFLEPVIDGWNTMTIIGKIGSFPLVFVWLSFGFISLPFLVAMDYTFQTKIFNNIMSIVDNIIIKE